MTRDEAIDNAEKAMGMMLAPGARSIEARKFVDMAVALGILKLDEPKAPYEILAEELNWGTSNTRFLKETLDRCGLRVVRM